MNFMQGQGLYQTDAWRESVATHQSAGVAVHHPSRHSESPLRRTNSGDSLQSLCAGRMNVDVSSKTS